MIIPANFKTFKDSLRAGCEIFHSLKNILLRKIILRQLEMKEVLHQTSHQIKNA